MNDPLPIPRRQLTSLAFWVKVPVMGIPHGTSISATVRRHDSGLNHVLSHDPGLSHAQLGLPRNRNFENRGSRFPGNREHGTAVRNRLEPQMFSIDFLSWNVMYVCMEMLSRVSGAMLVPLSPIMWQIILKSRSVWTDVGETALGISRHILKGFSLLPPPLKRSKERNSQCEDPEYFGSACSRCTFSTQHVAHVTVRSPCGTTAAPC